MPLSPYTAKDNFIFGFLCPYCSHGHLLSALGVRPIASEAEVEFQEPALSRVDAPEGEIRELGPDTVGVRFVRAQCRICENVIEIGLDVNPVEPDPTWERNPDPDKPALRLL